MLRRTKQLKKSAKNSFWQPGNYKKTTKRIRNGYKLCSTLHQLFEERAEIEASYAKKLKDWAKLCNTILDKGPEYGTMRNALKGILEEAECLSAIHTRVKNRLKCGEFQELKIWQNCAYTPVFTKVEEYKKMQEQFEKAQKPYAKHLAKVESAKRKYHKQCEEHRILLNQVRWASSEVKLSPVQKKTMVAYVERSKSALYKSRELYQKALQNINEYHPTYVHDMSTLFTKCQEMEGARLTLFKSALFSVHRALNIIQDSSLSQIYEDFHKTVDDADYRIDLDWWSRNYGADMPVDLPSFDEYPDFEMLASKYETVYKLIDQRDRPKQKQKPMEQPPEETQTDQRALHPTMMVDNPLKNEERQGPSGSQELRNDTNPDSEVCNTSYITDHLNNVSQAVSSVVKLRSSSDETVEAVLIKNKEERNVASIV